MVYGYIRVSTDKQDVESQKMGVERKAKELDMNIDEYIADEGISGIKEYNERALGKLVDKMQDGDVLIVPELSRLARTVFMLFRIVEQVTQVRGATIYAVKEGQTLKKNDVVSGILLAAYGTAAQIEREMICKRTQEGLDRRRRDGVVFGRPLGGSSVKKLDGREDELRKYAALGINGADIARLMDVSRMTVYSYCLNNGINLKYSNSGRYSHSRKDLYVMLNNERENIKKMFEDGMFPKEVCEKLGINRNSFSGWYRRPENEDVYMVAITHLSVKRAEANKGCKSKRDRY